MVHAVYANTPVIDGIGETCSDIADGQFVLHHLEAPFEIGKLGLVHVILNVTPPSSISRVACGQ